MGLKCWQIIWQRGRFCHQRHTEVRVTYKDIVYPTKYTSYCVVLCFAGVISYMMTSSDGNIFRVTGPLCASLRPVARSFDVFFDLHMNQRLSKQLRHRWFETPSRSLRRHCNDLLWIVWCILSCILEDWFNPLGPSDAIWRWWCWSTLVQAMACCLTAPSHYLNQCWLIISKVLWHSSEDIIIRRFEDTNQ